jgi:hypothetical protein
VVSPLQFAPGMSDDQLRSALNQNFTQIANESQTKVFKDENGVNRIIMGRYPDGTYGIKASPEGVDVVTAAENQLVFNSNRNMFKIYETDVVPYSYSFPLHGASSNGVDLESFSIPHDLGYPPVFVVYFDISTYKAPVPHTGINAFAANANAIFTVDAISNDTEILITVGQAWWTGAGGSIPALSSSGDFRYYILQETAGD